MDNNSEKIEKPPSNEEGSVDEEDVTALEKATGMIENIALIDTEAAKKPIRNDKTIRKKSQTLTVESVRTLLEHRFHMILSKEASNLDFLKYLFVSKVFFNVARRYPIFCLAFGYRSENALLAFTDLLRFKLPIINKAPKCSDVIALSYQKMDSLLSMLKPNHFLMEFEDSNCSNETVMKAIQHLDLAPGKIALAFKRDFQTELSLLFDHFAHRKLDYFWGSADFLTRLNVTLNVCHYTTSPPINNVQLQKILSHRIDSLSCTIDDNFIEMDPNDAASLQSLNSDHCTSLKWLDVICNRSYDSLMPSLEIIKDKCSKLKGLTIYVAILRDRDPNDSIVSDVDEILNEILYAKGKVQKIVEKCIPLTSNLKISSSMSMLYISDDEFSCGWIERAKNMDWFKDAVHDDSVKQGNNHEFNVCQLQSKFTDGFLELDHKTMIFHILPE